MTSSVQPFPRVPDYAWAWLQRSRPLLHELARRLTGEPPAADFLEAVRADFDRDPFVAGVVADTVADVAFSGRVPPSRPAGVSWDRGLTWWGAALAGVPLEQYDTVDAPPSGDRPVPAQRALFDVEPAADGGARRRRSRAGAAQRERRALALALRQLLDAGDGEQVPASAVRQLLAQLEGS